MQTKKKRQDSDQQCQRFKGNTDPDTQIVVKLHIVGQTEGRRIENPNSLRLKITDAEDQTRHASGRKGDQPFLNTGDVVGRVRIAKCQHQLIIHI